MTPTKTARAPRLRLAGLMEIWPLSLDQYRQSVAEGIFGDDEVDFLDGYLISPASQTTPRDPDAPQYKGRALWPMTQEQFQQMIVANILEEDDPVELLDGYMVALERGGGPGMLPSPEHSSSTSCVTGRLNKRLPDNWVVHCQNPIRLVPSKKAQAGNQPQPDAAVAKGPYKRYSHRYPGPGDLLLVVEVGDSSLLTDQRFKRVRYAKSGIPIYWIVNLVDRQLEVYRDPDTKKGEYRTEEIYSEDQSVVLAWEGLEPVTFAVAEFLA